MRLGTAEGRKDGCIDGRVLGIELGMKLGTAEGSKDGCMDGSVLGT